jgi:hypothetical protein
MITIRPEEKHHPAKYTRRSHFSHYYEKWPQNISPIIFKNIQGILLADVVFMHGHVIRWGNDVAMGVSFLVCFITGMFKFTFFMRLSGLTTRVLPIAQMSNLHDWSGLALGIFVAVHLVLNRIWIMMMTRKILSGEKMKP